MPTGKKTSVNKRRTPKNKRRRANLSIRFPDQSIGGVKLPGSGRKNLQKYLRSPQFDKEVVKKTRRGSGFIGEIDFEKNRINIHKEKGHPRSGTITLTRSKPKRKK
jgi:hypothetical protein